MSSYISSWFGSSVSSKAARQADAGGIDARSQVEQDQNDYFETVEQQTGEIERAGSLMFEEFSQTDLT